MGSALGRSWAAGGAHVVTTVAGRSARTVSLADGLEQLPGLDDVVSVADVVVSIGPPGLATEMASAIAAACVRSGRQPLVADLNAIAPVTVEAVAAILDGAGCELVDGSISGPPPTPTGSTRLYLSGLSAEQLAGLPAPGLVTYVVGADPGTASAVKMCTASIYKGYVGLLLQALLAADTYGVTDLVLTDLAPVFGDLLTEPATQLALAAAKSDRYPGEMLQIALTQESAGAEPALFRAMAQVYERVAGTALATHSPETAAHLSDLAAVIAELRTARPPH